jgi:tetratricopeptide (TPR) repeat protein
MKSKFIIGITLAFLLASCQPTIQELFNKADNFYEQKKYDQAIDVYTQIIKRKFSLQRAFYNRGLCYMALKKYDRALWNFNIITSSLSINWNPIFTPDEAKAQVPYNDALYQRAQAYFYLDSLKSSFRDFQVLIDNNDVDKISCLLWQGVIYARIRDTARACTFFNKAKQAAVTTEDKGEVNRMINAYCEKGSHLQ